MPINDFIHHLIIKESETKEIEWFIQCSVAQQGHYNWQQLIDYFEITDREDFVSNEKW